VVARGNHDGQLGLRAPLLPGQRLGPRRRRAGRRLARRITRKLQKYPLYPAGTLALRAAFETLAPGIYVYVYR